MYAHAPRSNDLVPKSNSWKLKIRERESEGEGKREKARVRAPYHIDGASIKKSRILIVNGANI